MSVRPETRQSWVLWRRDIEREAAKPAYLQSDVWVDCYRLGETLDHIDRLESVQAVTVADAAVLREAARILRRRSKRPKSFWLGVLCRVLRDTADKVEEEAT